MAERDCDKCGDSTKLKYLGKINGESLCKKCRKEVRLNHRKETENQSSEEEREKIRELTKKQTAASNKARYEKNKKEKQSMEVPVIKGSTKQKKKEKSQSYFPFEERKLLLGLLVRRGMEFEDAKDRIKSIVDQQTTNREEMKAKNKSEEEMKSKQRKLIEELWNY